MSHSVNRADGGGEYFPLSCVRPGGPEGLKHHKSPTSYYHNPPPLFPWELSRAHPWLSSMVFSAHLAIFLEPSPPSIQLGLNEVRSGLRRDCLAVILKERPLREEG